VVKNIFYNDDGLASLVLFEESLKLAHVQLLSKLFIIHQKKLYKKKSFSNNHLNFTNK